MTGIRTIEDIRQRCVIDSDTGCWIWSMYCEPRTGRPDMRIEVEPGVRRSVRLSVALHLIKTGSVPAQGDRAYYPLTCRNKKCCNPAHQKLLTKGQINKLVGGHGAAARAKIAAANYGKGRLSAQDRAEIREGGMLLSEIVERYGISMGYASTLRRGIVGAPPSAPGSSVFSWRPA